MNEQTRRIISLVVLLSLQLLEICNSYIHPYHNNNHHLLKRKINENSAKTFQLHSATEQTIEETAPTSTSKPKNFCWPTRPADALALPYDTIVEGAHIRHIVTLTTEMADLAMETYMNILKGQDDELDDKKDPFGHCADLFSVCASKEDGGRVGWTDNPNFTSVNPSLQNKQEYESISILPKEVITKLFEKKPKGGDLLKIPYINDNKEEKEEQWHIIMVDDIQIPFVAETGTYGNTVSTSKSRARLSGKGIFAKPHDATESKYYQMITLGCQMNVADSERMEGVLQSHLNLLPLPEIEKDVKKKMRKKKEEPDVVIFNTCSIRDHAEQKLYDALGPIANRKRAGDAVSVVVAGCVAQQEGQKLIRRFPEIDLVMGPQYVNRLPTLLDYVQDGHQVVATDPTLIMEDDFNNQGGSLLTPVRGSDLKAWVNIIYGCNEHCTYCVVPATRGVEQSRTMENILLELKGLEAKGYKEVALLGQNIDAYGRDMVPKRNFADLLQYLNDNLDDDGIQRIRYVTSHPRYFSDRVIDAVANLPKVCESFLLPFQSGDNHVLKQMRRGYTFESYMKIIDKIKHKAPDASICGDVIVGFPGETDKGFQRTLDLMEEVKFDNLNSYAYSPRPNTEAESWEDQIPESVKSERLQILQNVAREHAQERSERYLHTVVEVLVDDINPKNPTKQVQGRNRQNRPIFFDGNLDELKGTFVNVLITEARPYSLSGVIV